MNRVKKFFNIFWRSQENLNYTICGVFQKYAHYFNHTLGCNLRFSRVCKKTQVIQWFFVRKKIAKCINKNVETFCKVFWSISVLSFFWKNCRMVCKLQVANLNSITASYGNVVTSFIYCTISQRASRPIHLLSW